jgi:predicted metal-binding protein
MREPRAGEPAPVKRSRPRDRDRSGPPKMPLGMPPGKAGRTEGRDARSASRETCQRRDMMTGRGAPVSGSPGKRPGPPVFRPRPPSPGQMMDQRAPPAPTELLVCVKCRRGRDVPEDARRPGQRLYDELAARDLPAGLTLRPVECLQNCDHGCSVALRGGARWTYVYGNLDEGAQPDMLLEGAALYHATPDGLIPWRARPEHFKRNCIARIPPMGDPEDFS